MQTVRKRILEILKQKRQATVADLARQLGMAPVSVRYHLDILQGDNLIEVSKVRREGNVGRPRQVYSLTGEAGDFFPDNCAQLTVGLVRQMKKVLPPEQVELAFAAIAEEIASELEISDDEPLSDRLERVTHFLSERSYFARWEQQEQNGEFLLHAHHCPYADISPDHPELCQMDLTLISRLVGQPCERGETIADSGRCCTFRISGDRSVDKESSDKDSVDREIETIGMRTELGV